MNTKTSTFAGTWHGFYSYGGPGNIFDFTLKIDSCQADSITGTILEQDHADPIAISGFIHPPSIRFFKVGGNKKSVRYFEPVEFQGFMSSDGLNVSGSWTNASAKGDWSAQREDTDEDARPETDEPQSEVDINAVMNAPAYGNQNAAPVAPAEDPNELVARDAPVDSWDPEEEPDHAPAGGLASAFKTQPKDLGANVRSFFTVDPLQSEPDLGKTDDTVEKGYSGLPPAVPSDEEKSDDSGTFIDDSVANSSAFSVDPAKDGPDIARAIIEARRNKNAPYSNAAPSVIDEDKVPDAGSFINKSVANKSPFQVDPMVGETEPIKAPSSGQTRYAADTDYDPLDYGVDKKDTATSAMVHNPDSNRSVYSVDPVGNELDLLAKSGDQQGVNPSDVQSIESSASQLVNQIGVGINNDLEAAAPDLSGIAGVLPANPMFNTQAIQPQQAVPPAPLPPVTSSPPSATISPDLGASPAPAPPSQLNSSSSTCPRCGAERGGFSFCMSCGHSFDLSV